MKSEDYKRGVRDMAEAIRGNFPGRRWPVTHQIIDGAEQRLLADPVPVPKFKVGEWVCVAPSFKNAMRITSSTSYYGEPHIYALDSAEGVLTYQESQLRALTPLEATRKE